MSALQTPPRAATQRSLRPSIVWVIPMVAVAIGAWLAWDTLSKRGPTITISFESAEGLQAGQSQLKFKDIVFGTVQGLELTSDHSRVLVTIATTRQACCRRRRRVSPSADSPGREDPPVLQAHEPGHTFLLKAKPARLN